MAAAAPKDMTAEQFMGTAELVAQLNYIVEHSAYRVPTHIIEDVCRRAALLLAFHQSEMAAVNPGLDSGS